MTAHEILGRILLAAAVRDEVQQRLDERNRRGVATGHDLRGPLLLLRDRARALNALLELHPGDQILAERDADLGRAAHAYADAGNLVLDVLRRRERQRPRAQRVLH